MGIEQAKTRIRDAPSFNQKSAKMLYLELWCCCCLLKSSQIPPLEGAVLA